MNGKLISFCVDRPISSNYTPRSLMLQYAKEHPEMVSVSPGLTTALTIFGVRCVYDHWSITRSAPDIETVTVYLSREM